ncbi:MAG: PmoA family protein [Rubripirellula sp.]
MNRCFSNFLTFVLFISATVVLAFPAAAEAPKSETMRIEASADPEGWMIYDGDTLVAGYRIESNGKPIVYPVMGPSGQEMVRRYPIEDALETEKKDHQHHRSMWMTHGEVNGFDFWADEKNEGDTVHRKGTATVTPDGAAVIVTENDWISPQGKRVMSDTRRVAFFKSDGRRLIDYSIVFRATDGDVNFGDTKEGTFGIRVAGTMKVDAKLGGLITSATGLHDAEAWGKKAAWVDYSGPVNGETAGATIHDHPSNYGFPCAWHVRTYGLFAANPFGVSHFTGGPHTGGVDLKAGDEMQLSYRVVLHDGGLDLETAKADQAKFASETVPTIQ